VTDIAKLQIRVESMEVQLADKRLDDYKKAALDAEKATKRLTDGSNKATRGFGNLKNQIAGAFAALGGIVLLKKALATIAEFETGLIGVGKTTGILGDELQSLGDDIRGISSRVPLATRDLLALAQTAGQLGIKGNANIARFTETVGKLSISTNLIGEDAATAFARILTITGTAVSEVDQLGSAIVRLGNNFAATESEIAGSATRVAQGTAQFDVSAAAVLSIGTALSAVGVEAEAGGTQVGLAFQKINTALRNGGKQMKLLEEITGESGDALREKFFNGRSAEVFESFITGIGRIGESGGDVTKTLTGLGLQGVRAVAVLGTLAKRADVLSDTLRQGQAGYEENIALNEEAAVATEAFSAQIQLLRNDLDAIVSQGDIEQLTGGITELREVLQDPNVAKGIQTLITGGIKLAEVFVRASAEIANTASLLGEDFARATTKAGDELSTVLEEIERLKALEGSSFLSRTFLIPGRLGFQIDDSEIESELNSLRDRANALASAEKLSIPFPIEVETRKKATAQLDEINVTTKRRKVIDPIAEEKAKLTAGEKLIKQLEEELALYGDLTLAQKTRISLEKGYIKTATQGEATRIQSLANEITAREQAKEAASEASNLSETNSMALESLREGLRTEEEAIQESYSKRLQIILDNTLEGSTQQNDLKTRLDEQFATQALGNLDIVDTYEEQLQEVEDYYTRRRDLILANTQLTEEQRTALEEELTLQRNQRLEQLEAQRTSVILGNSASLFGELAGLSKTFAGEQSTTYKAMFALSKAFAVADAVVKIQQGIAAASAAPWPTNLAAIASTVAATSSVISTISGTEFSGAYDKGGTIPRGKIGLVGEFGPELIQGPTNVTSRKETAKMFKGGGDKAGPAAAPQINVKNINVLDPTVVGDYLATDAGEQLIMNVVQRNQRAIGF